MELEERFIDLRTAMGRVEVLRQAAPRSIEARGHNYNHAITRLNKLHDRYLDYKNKHDRRTLSNSDIRGMRVLAQQARSLANTLNRNRPGYRRRRWGKRHN